MDETDLTLPSLLAERQKGHKRLMGHPGIFNRPFHRHWVRRMSFHPLVRYAKLANSKILNLSIRHLPSRRSGSGKELNRSRIADQEGEEEDDGGDQTNEIDAFRNVEKLQNFLRPTGFELSSIA